MLSSTSHDAGFFIAEGLGMSTATSATSSGVTSSTPIPSIGKDETTSTIAALSSVGLAQASTSTSMLSSVASKSNSTMQSASQSTPIALLAVNNGTLNATHTGNVFTTTKTYFYNNSNIVTTQTLTNTSWALATNAAQCWTEWETYWSLHLPTPATIGLSSGSQIFTSTQTYIYTRTSFVTTSPFTVTGTVTSTLPTLVTNGGFTQTVSPSFVVSTRTSTGSAVPVETWTTSDYQTWIGPSVTFVTYESSHDPAWPTPSCSLPAVYSDCQSSWETYATTQAIPYPQALPANCPVDWRNATTIPDCFTGIASGLRSWSSQIYSSSEPQCTQASITGALCTSLKDAYVFGSNGNLYPTALQQMPGIFSSGSISYPGMFSEQGWIWPSYQQFAPGCSLGCGRCAITGGVVQLLFFPPGLSHPATGPVVATTLGTTLTSPTHYISFASVHASDACSGVGQTIGGTILAVPESVTMSSLFATTMPCDAHRKNNPWLGTTVVGTASFNISDMMLDPVPYSIYTSQPFCASEIFQSACDPNSCRTDLPYRPLIVLPEHLLQELDPSWATCSMDLRGLYDPPKALVPATAIAGPSMTASDTIATISATPGVTVPEPTPTATGGAQPVPTTTQVSAVPEQQPSTQPSTATDPVATSPSQPSAVQGTGTSAPAAPVQSPSPNESPAPAQGSTSPTPPNPQVSAAVPGSGTNIATTGNADSPVSPSPPAPAASSSVTLVAGQTLQPGSSAVVVSGTTFTALPGGSGVGVIASGTTSTIAPVPASSVKPASNANNPVVIVTSGAANAPGASAGSPQAQSSATVVAGQTLSVGGSAVVVSGTTFSALAGTSGVAAIAQGSTRIIVPVVTSTPNNAGAVASVVAVPLDPAGSVTATIAVPQSNGAAAPITLPDGQVVTVEATTIAAAATTLTRSGVTLTVSSQSGNLIVNGQTLSAGAAATSINGVALSIDPSGQLIDTGSTNTIATGSTPGTFIVDGNVIAAGDPAVQIGDETFSVDAAGHLLEVEGSKTMTLTPGSTSGVMVVDGTTLSACGSPVTIGDEVYTVNSAGQLLEVAPATTLARPQGSGVAVIVDGTTLLPGAPAQTVAGVILSVNLSGQLLQLGPATTSASVSVVSSNPSPATRAASASGTGGSGAADPAAATQTTGIQSDASTLLSSSRLLFMAVLLTLIIR